RTAIDAWKGIVKAAGDVYTDDLKMGVRVADLCGHWKDELVVLEKGLAGLDSVRRGMTAAGTKAPAYHPEKAMDCHTLFRVTHQPVVTAPAGKPITIRVRVTADAGIDWLHLRYRSVNQEEGYQTLSLMPTGEKDVYA